MDFDTKLNVDTIVGLFGFLLALLSFLYLQYTRNRIEKHRAYQELEFAANRLFEFTGVHGAAIHPFTQEQPPPEPSQISLTGQELAANHLFQTLNLFELAVRARKDDMIAAEVFASWVIWYYDTWRGWYFRKVWPEVRCNYTEDLRAILDFHTDAEGEARKSAFFQHVSRKMKRCSVVTAWLDGLRSEAQVHE